MTRPAVLPATVKEFIQKDINTSYVARQRLMASMTAWSNRHGPVKMVQGPPPLRSMDLIPEGDPRLDVADYIDALQTALVAAQTAQGADPARVLSLLQAALNTHTWHP